MDEVLWEIFERLLPAHSYRQIKKIHCPNAALTAINQTELTITGNGKAVIGTSYF